MSDTIKKGKVVDLSYVLKDSEGEVLDEAGSNDPFNYLHGADQIVPGLENALAGLKVGDKKDVTVNPTEGYGELDPKLMMTVKRAQFPAGAELEEGMSFEASGGDGQGMIFTIESIQNDEIQLNGNHPLAGVTLHFSVEVLGIREATEEEISHGHAHGPEGHGHEHHHHEHGEDCDHGHDDDDGHGHGPLH